MDDHLFPEGCKPQRLLVGAIREFVRAGDLVRKLITSDDGVLGQVLLRRQDRDLLGDRYASVGVIAGDHDDLNACCLALLHGLLDTWFGRVLNTEQADKAHVIKELSLSLVLVDLVPIEVRRVARTPLRYGQHTAGLAHECLLGRGDGCQHLFVHRALITLITNATVATLAELEHALRCTLDGEDLLPIVDLLGHKHPLVGRVEGNFVNSRIIHNVLHGFHAPRCHSSLHERHLCRRAHVLSRSLDHSGVVADTLPHHLRWQVTLILPLALGEILCEGGAPRAVNSHHLPERHLTRGQSARLVRADHGDTAQSLHCIQLADEHVVRGHLLRRDHEGYRYRGDETLRHLGEEGPGRIGNNVPNGVLRWRKEVGEERGKTHNHGHDGYEVHKVLDLHLQR
mmetsp:Transcript_38534/g.111324  ORF Transcript_38534/g.111324 Transcript_38534/m.111324 type:complete len:398 (+) Transcript_38534:1183-2376(+)